ncbi:antibiotic biosynthesis monooxygenase [Bacillus pumilus]|uniref:antibiotic biosynthesis monooxygenase family protein n=1 Tax=Bacillus TaxID=1386 RepID=UPI0006818959|nr:antibiotic biosynthesis monooxygenase [Bacillus pumilus]KMY20218.1 Heme-degrading monooxygenase HmoB [Bacillus pumilus]MBR0590819.1 antibiotic biosynthesis monooxygenase [Bacillus pumilus sxm20-2]MCI4617409.1 antibiotic biosynthesis monooxygenase [Bacillus pumilus]MCY7435287.1 antibiotic biosynthesis monooxygenase [Bacillus pumilus]MDR0121037.1 antibiotic biosynthesis monooxygenase [Bacillus pumilus]
MNVYITYGTADFLHKIAKKHDQENLLYMVGKEQAALFHETEGETVFKAPHAYDVIYAKGELVQPGFVTLNHIPVKLESRALFESTFQKKTNISEHQRGFQALRVLRPKKDEEVYLIMTLWASEDLFEDFQESEAFFQPNDDTGSIFSRPAYLTSYHAVTDN